MAGARELVLHTIVTLKKLCLLNNQGWEQPMGGKKIFLSASTDKFLKIVCDKLDALILKCVSEQVCSNVFSTEGLYFVNLNMS